jgi:hypothetical protein
MALAIQVPRVIAAFGAPKRNTVIQIGDEILSRVPKRHFSGENDAIK